MDWAILLEFTKALATPVAAGLVALLGFRSWRKQKVLERRLDWHERFQALLGKVANAYYAAAGARDKLDRDEVLKRYGEALQVSAELLAVSEEAWLYATQKGFDATRKLRLEMTEIHKDLPIKGGITDEMSARVSACCGEAQGALATEIRHRMGMEKLRL